LARHTESLADLLPRGSFFPRISHDDPTASDEQIYETTSSAYTRFNRTYVDSYARCQVRLGNALVRPSEIDEATRILGEAASHASLSPRLTKELHAARALMQPWTATHAAKTLDAQLEACGFMSNQKSWPRIKIIVFFIFSPKRH
jgi:hypothetical protein